MMFDPLGILRLLQAERVEFVLIGGLAGNAFGSTVATVDLDICYRRTEENTQRLASALRRLDARLRGVDEDVPFLLDARTLAAGDSFTFTTELGDLDIIGHPAGTEGYEDLSDRAIEIDLDGLNVLVADLDDQIRMKKASGRGKDLAHLHVLVALKEELEGQAE